MILWRLKKLIESKNPYCVLLRHLERRGAEEEYHQLLADLVGENTDEADIEYLVFKIAGLPVDEFREMDIFERLDWLRAISDRPTGSSASGINQPKPLTQKQQEIYDWIRDDGPFTGSQIANEYGFSESTFTSRYVPALKSHGIENRPGLGYYHPETYRPE